ncbi:hypothetical protein Ancab_036950 [Ancistrocladus abbreviatus]
MGESTGPSVSLMCRLFYCIFGLDSAVNSILKMPKALFQSIEVSFIISADHALNQNDCLESVVSSSLSCLSSHEEIMEMHLLIGMSKSVKQGSDDLIDMQSGVGHLKKAFHMYPNSTSIRHINFINGLLETILRLTFWHTLCHVHAAADNYINLKGEYMRCLNLQTYYPVGWMCLKFIESQYDLLDEVNSFYEGFRGGVNGSEGSQHMWMAMYNLLLGLISAWAQDLVHAEELTGKACSLVAWLVQRAASSYAKMEASTLAPATLCHRCVDYLGVRVWSDAQVDIFQMQNLLRIKPTEIYFQMYLLEKQSTDGSQPSSGTDGNEILQRWILKAIHLNHSCSRYWKALLNYVD